MRQRFEHTAGAWKHDDDEDSVVLAATGQLISRFTRSSYDVDRTISCVNGCDAAGIVEPGELKRLLRRVNHRAACSTLTVLTMIYFAQHFARCGVNSRGLGMVAH